MVPTDRLLAIVFATAIVASPAWAEETQPRTDPVGAAIGFRASWGFPFGGIGEVRPADQQALALGDVATNALIVGPELGIATPSLRVTAFAELGWLGSRPSALGCGTAPAAGAAEPSCGASIARAGVTLERPLAPTAGGWRPWIGGGAGYEWLTLRGAEPNPLGVPVGRTIGGFELARVAIGADRGDGASRVGPFVALSFGRYHSGAIARPDVHAWLLLGLRYSFTSSVRR